MVQQSAVPRTRDPRHRVLLMRAKLDRRVHAGKFQIAPVIARQAYLIEQPVIRLFQVRPPVRIGIDPIGKRFLYLVLLLPCRDRFAFIEYALFLPVLLYRIVNLRRALIQTILEQTKRIRPIRAIRFRRKITRIPAHRFRALYLPRTVKFVI